MLTWLLPVHVAEVDARVAVGQRELQLLAVDAPGVGAVGQDVGDVRVDVGRVLDPPVELEDEVAVLLLARRGSCPPWPRSGRRSRSRRQRPSSGRCRPRGPSIATGRSRRRGETNPGLRAGRGDHQGAQVLGLGPLVSRSWVVARPGRRQAGGSRHDSAGLHESISSRVTARRREATLGAGDPRQPARPARSSRTDVDLDGRIGRTGELSGQAYAGPSTRVDSHG